MLKHSVFYRLNLISLICKNNYNVLIWHRISKNIDIFYAKKQVVYNPKGTYFTHKTAMVTSEIPFC